MSLLDILVRTDTVGVGGVVRGCFAAPVRCDVCGLPLSSCDCIPGVDY